MKKPFIIGIGGTHSSVGKTTLASAILKYLTNPHSRRFNKGRYGGSKGSSVNTGHPALISEKKWGAIKYTRTSSSPSIITDKNILMEKGKDTRNMMDGGAKEVLWVKAPRFNINKLLPKAVKMLSHLDGIIVEGNSAIEFLKPDIVIFILGGEKNLWKPGIGRFFAKADIILYEDESALPEITDSIKLFHRDLSNKESKGVFQLISVLLMKKELKKEIMKKAINGKLTCPAARKIAEKLRTPYKEIGAAADELNIKIKNCQLDCF